MDKISIIGGTPLVGSVQISGAKNAALPILFATLLVSGKTKIKNLPQLNDIETTLQVLKILGANMKYDVSSHMREINCSQVESLEAPYDLVRKMRASVLVLGPLLARFGQAKVSLPGGCAIGARPVGYHLSGLKALGASIELEQGYVLAKTQKKLIGNKVVFEFPSVGATENILMAAVLAKGESVLENCAKEPEIVDLANFLIKAGAKIEGAGSETIHVQGVDTLSEVEYSVMADRIEAATYLAAGLSTGGSVRVNGIDPENIESVLAKFEEAGAKIKRGIDFVESSIDQKLKGTDVITQPFPGFPTDMQAQFMAMMCIAAGTSIITENIFENRFMHVAELTRMGAQIEVKGKSAVVRGVNQLKAAPLMATDLRASASLVIAALCAEGESKINRIYHLDRGYEKIEEKLKNLGAKIFREKS